MSIRKEYLIFLLLVVGFFVRIPFNAEGVASSDSLSSRPVYQSKDCYPLSATDILIEDFENLDAAQNWSFSNGPEFPGADGRFEVLNNKGIGSSSGGALSFDFSGGGVYVEIVRILSYPVPCEGISFWLSGHVPGSNIMVRMRDETNQTFQKFITIRPDIRSTWNQYFIASKDDYDVYWGGANDGVFHGALTAISLGIHNGINYYKKGTTFFDDIYALHSFNTSDVKIDPFGADAGQTFYQGKVSNLLGVNIHFVKPDERQLNRAAQAGFGFVRMNLTWDSVEKYYGVYDFSDYDNLVKSLESRGMGALFIVSHANRLYYDGPGDFDFSWGPQTKGTRDAYARFAAEAAHQWAGKNVMLEIWNEPNLRNFWNPKPNANHYHLLAAASLKAIKQANPNMPVLVGATGGCDVAFIDKVLKNKKLKELDAITIHPYRLNNPETFYQEALIVDIVVKKRTKRNDIPIYSGEWGYSSTWYGGRTQKALKRQALYAIREILYNLLCGVKKTVYYDLKDDGNDADDKEHNFGLIKNQTLKPKPAFNTVKALYNLLPSKECELAPIDTHLSSVYGILFKGTKKRLAVLWTIQVKPGVKLQIPFKQGMKFYNMYGKARQFQKNSGMAILTIREDTGPIYVKN